MAVNYIKKYITRNPYFNDKRYLSGDDFIGFFLHSVGCAQPDPLVFIRGWDNPDYTRAGVNGFIGRNEIYIIAPSLETVGKVKRMPHAGSPANNHYIGFEMTESKWIQYKDNGGFYIPPDKVSEVKAFCRATYQNAVDLFARLCLFHNKNPLQSKVILSHREGALLDIATNHGDPEYLWGKLSLGYTMDTFRQDVANRMKEELPSVVFVNNTDTSSLFPDDGEYSQVTAQIPVLTKIPYLATISRTVKNIDYAAMKSEGVVGVCLEAGYLYDVTHAEVKYDNPRLYEQVDGARKVNMAVALNAITRARSVEEAKREIYYLALCVRSTVPELGVWLYINLVNNKSVNDDILDTYRSGLERLGLSGKIGIYATKAQLSRISWDRHSNDWWLWIDSHLSSIGNLSELVTPHFFALDEVT